MLKVVCVVDKEKTAIDRLSQGMKPFNTNLDYQVLAVHPKRPDPQQLQAFEEAAMSADIIDWQYFRTAQMLKQRYPWLADKKQILTHHNPYSIEESDWNDFDLIVANNETILDRLGKITSKPLEYIPNCVDTDFWTFNEEWDLTKTVIMVANRIEGKKGILPAAIAAGELGLKFILVGSVSDPEYMFSIMQTGNVEFHEQISDEQLRELYWQSTIHICNSADNFESGTLPMLEAMMCGTPVLTRKIGHVPELNNGENLILNEAPNDDVGALTELLKANIFERKKLEDIRQKAWSTAKNRSYERRAYLYQKLYRQMMHETEVPVSVIVPIYDKQDQITKCLDAIVNQTYQNIELIVADDSGNNREIIEDFAKYVNIPVRYIDNILREDHKSIKDYGLARARNNGIIEATGDILVFCDQRMVMQSDAIEQFVYRMKPKHWLYGDKDGKKEFVENFSAAYRQEVINAGMFCERINAYGGMSQELRNRIRSQGFQTELVSNAKATPAGKSSNRSRKRLDIIRMKNRLYKMGLG